jgi:hypothetical protein
MAADLFDELADKLKGEVSTVEQLQQLPLLERVIKESMRVLPPVPWNKRVTSTTELGGYTLPAGTEVFVSQRSLIPIACKKSLLLRLNTIPLVLERVPVLARRLR